ncbi:MAG: hypothetical protein V4550_06905 [Gemmatimonadota bacterium]
MSARPLAQSDAAGARVLIEAQFNGTRYLARLLEQLDAALTGDDPEYCGLIADDGGLILYGPLAGAVGVVKLHAIVGDAEDVLHGVITDDARMIVCEIPYDAPFQAASETLLRRGFIREGRVDAWFSDEIALDILVYRPAH